MAGKGKILGTVFRVVGGIERCAIIALALCEKPAAEADVDGGCHLVACEYPQLDAAILQVSYRVGNAVL